MDKYTAIGVVVSVATVGAIGYILYNQYQQTKQSTITQTTGTSNTQAYSVHIYNSCNYSITVNYTDSNGNQQSINLLQGMGVTISVQPNSQLSITDSNGNQMLSPTPIQGNANITTCPSNLFQQVIINYVPTITQTQSVTGCVGQGCSSNGISVTLQNQCNQQVQVDYTDASGNKKTVYVQPDSSMTINVQSGSIIYAYPPLSYPKKFGSINSSQTITICQPSSTLF